MVFFWNTGRGHLVAICTITLLHSSVFFLWIYTPGPQSFYNNTCRENFTHWGSPGLSSNFPPFLGYIWVRNVWLWWRFLGLVTQYWLRSNVFVLNPEPDIQHTVQCQRLFLTEKTIYKNIRSVMRSLVYLPCQCLLYTQMTNDCRKWGVSWGVPQVNGTRHTLWLVTK